MDWPMLWKTATEGTGNWRETMPLWAHQELWKLRETWPSLGPVVGGTLTMVPAPDPELAPDIKERAYYDAQFLAEDGFVFELMFEKPDQN